MKANIHVYLSLNNIIVSLTDSNGNVLGWASGGSTGFSGFKKITNSAINLIILKMIDLIRKKKIHTVSVFFKGIGKGAETLINLLQRNKINVDIIGDVTEIPHNGCRPKKKRRL
jgi:small subunit ribosomal protein S11